MHHCNHVLAFSTCSEPNRSDDRRIGLGGPLYILDPAKQAVCQNIGQKTFGARKGTYHPFEPETCQAATS